MSRCVCTRTDRLLPRVGLIAYYLVRKHDGPNQAAQALPVAAAANAEYLRAKKNHADDDFCAVVEALRSKPEKINSNL